MDLYVCQCPHLPGTTRQALCFLNVYLNSFIYVHMCGFKGVYVCLRFRGHLSVFISEALYLVNCKVCLIYVLRLSV